MTQNSVRTLADLGDTAVITITGFAGMIDAWHATYVNGSVTKTVTRDSTGAVTAQPAITIA